jgi:hypothetical protein
VRCVTPPGRTAGVGAAGRALASQALRRIASRAGEHCGLYSAPAHRLPQATSLQVFQAGEALRAVPCGQIASIGSVGAQTVTVVSHIMRAPSATATEVELVSPVLTQAATPLAPDEAAVGDRGLPLPKLYAAGVGRSARPIQACV